MPSPVTNSELSHDAPARPRGLSRGTADIAVPDQSDGEAPQTVHAATQPAAIVSKSLERLASGESSIALSGIGDQSDTSNIQMKRDVTGSAGLISDPPPSSAPVDTNAVVTELKTQFKALAEVAVLAQANQMPEGAMPFSMSTES
jgi:hypothetical protein